MSVERDASRVDIVECSHVQLQEPPHFVDAFREDFPCGSDHQEPRRNDRLRAPVRAVIDLIQQAALRASQIDGTLIIGPRNAPCPSYRRP